jgi:hypothetical protein
MKIKQYLLAAVATVAIALAPVKAQAQYAYSGFGPPQGSCNPGTLGIDRVTATLYKCNTGGGWVAESSGSSFNGGAVGNGITAPFFSATGPGAGVYTFGAGSAPASIASNAVTEGGPATVTTSYYAPPPSAPPPNDGNAYVMAYTLVSTTPYDALSANWVLPTGSSLGGASFSSQGGGYTSFTFNGNNSDGSRLGMVAGGTGDSNLYLDTPGGAGFTFRVNNVAKAFINANGVVTASVVLNGSTPTQGAACSVNNAIVGADSTHLYVCIGSVIKSATLN